MITWYIIFTDIGDLCSIGTVINEADLEAKGYTWQTAEFPEGIQPTWNGTALVEPEPVPEPVPVKSLEQQIADLQAQLSNLTEVINSIIN